MKGHQKSKVKYITVGDIIQVYIVQGKIFCSYDLQIDERFLKSSLVQQSGFCESDCNNTILNCTS